MATVFVLAGVWALLPACGGVAVTDVLPACGADTCGKCANGTVNQDSCSASGKWTCSCVPVEQCGAAPTCGLDENQFASAALCAQSGATSCRAQTICGTTIWCGQRRPGPDVVWPATATGFTADDDGGGFVPSPPPNSSCATGEAHYTYTRATQLLAWRVCDTSGAPYVMRSGSRVLGANERAQVEAAMSELTVAQAMSGCGADKPALSVTVTKASGSTRYLDSFDSCTRESGGPYVDHIDGLFSALRSIASP